MDRTKTSIIFIWSSNVILGEAKLSHIITLHDQINMILGVVLSSKCFIIIKATGGPTQRVLHRAVQQLKMLPRADIKSHFDTLE